MLDPRPGEARAVAKKGWECPRLMRLDCTLYHTAGFIVIFAVMQVLDPALTRPGRLSRRVVVPLPDEAGRADILAVHLRNTPMTSDADKDFCRRQIARISSEHICRKLWPIV